MRGGDYAFRCRGCRWLREWPEKTAWEREALGGGCGKAYMCVHPERPHPARVEIDDAPYNCCSTATARECPMKLNHVLKTAIR